MGAENLTLRSIAVAILVALGAVLSGPLFMSEGRGQAASASVVDICTASLDMVGAPSNANSAFVQYPDAGIPASMVLTASMGFSGGASQPQGAGMGLQALDQDLPLGPLFVTFDQPGTLTMGTVTFGFADGSVGQAVSLADARLDCNQVDNLGCTSSQVSFRIAQLAPQTGATSLTIQLHPAPEWTLASVQGASASQSGGAGQPIILFDSSAPFGPYQVTVAHAGATGNIWGPADFVFPDGSMHRAGEVGTGYFTAPCSASPDILHPKDVNADCLIEFGEFTQSRSAVLGGSGSFADYTAARTALLQGKYYDQLFPDKYRCSVSP